MFAAMTKWLWCDGQSGPLSYRCWKNKIKNKTANNRPGTVPLWEEKC